MIDTGRFFYRPNNEEIEVIEKKHFKPVKSGNFTWCLNLSDEGIKMDYRRGQDPKSGNTYHIFLIVFNVTKIIGKLEVLDDDYLMLVEKIDNVLSRYFKELRVNKLELSRIDFKIDIFTPYKNIYVDILKKINTTYRKKIKKTYKTSVYYRGNGYNINLYDKEAKNPDQPEYKDLLRLEIQLQRRYLKQITKDKSEITLKNFFSSDMRRYIFNRILEPLIYTGDYYTVNKSRNILKKHYRPSTVDKIIVLQELIYENGITEAKKLVGTHRNTIGKHFQKLKECNINPITFKKFEDINTLPSLINILYNK